MFLVSRPRAPASAGKAAQPNVFNQSAGAYGGALNLANMAGNLGFGFNPMQAGQIGGMNLSQYMNPYTQQVIGAAQGDLNRSRQMAMNDVGQQATAAGAFGGSRHGLVEAETNRGFADASADMSAGLRQAGYQNAQQMALADIGNRMGADQFNATTGLQAQQMRAGNMLNASGQLGNLANLGFGFGQQTNAMQAQSGAQQQALQQQLIDAARAQYGGFTNSPYQGLAALLSGTSGTPTPSSQSTSKNPGLFDFLSAGASILGAFCWVSRAAYGAEDGRWLTVRKWMLTKAPTWLFRAYVRHGPALAAWIERHPSSKPVFRRALSALTGA